MFKICWISELDKGDTMNLAGFNFTSSSAACTGNARTVANNYDAKTSRVACAYTVSSFTLSGDKADRTLHSFMS